jgi:hypothetical protein
MNTPTNFYQSLIIIHRQSKIPFGCMKPSPNYFHPWPLTIDKFCWRTLTLRNFGQMFWQIWAIDIMFRKISSVDSVPTSQWLKMNPYRQSVSFSRPPKKISIVNLKTFPNLENIINFKFITMNLGCWSRDQTWFRLSIHWTLLAPLASIKMWILTLQVESNSVIWLIGSQKTSQIVLRNLKLELAHEFGDLTLIIHRFPPNSS